MTIIRLVTLTHLSRPGADGTRNYRRHGMHAVFWPAWGDDCWRQCQGDRFASRFLSHDKSASRPIAAATDDEMALHCYCCMPGFSCVSVAGPIRCWRTCGHQALIPCQLTTINRVRVFVMRQDRSVANRTASRHGRGHLSWCCTRCGDAIASIGL
jgi:hypothetical protein